MTDHLPECPWSEPCQPMHGGNPCANHYAGTIGGQTPNPPYCSNCAVWCICDRLRACEARVMASDEPWAKASAAANVESYDEGFAAGLAAARDAVAALFPQRRYPDEHAAILAAIDGCKPKGTDDE